MADATELTRMERLALGLGRMVNERPVPKRLQQAYLRQITQAWVRFFVARRVYVDGIEPLIHGPRDRGVVLAGNHRSFFDMWAAMLALYEGGARWIRRTYFPVRSNFFYERGLGLAVNYGVGGGVMYPPIFRDASKAELNKDALERVSRFLSDSATVVGLHPEGTRNKGADPYELLKAQPGVGQIVLHAKPIVFPVFINGLPAGEFLKSITDSFHPDARQRHPIIVCFGPELDYSALTAKKPRAALYKRCADMMRDAIIEVSGRERELRERCERGAMPDDDPGWIANRKR